jgi:hypothetical protein
MNKMKITVDEIPLSKNKYVNMHWSKRAKYKENIEWLIYSSILQAGCPLDAEISPYSRATVIFDIYFKYKRKRDTANFLGGGLISWLDALVDLAIIEDDNYDCIGQPVVNFYVDKDNPRTEITVERR